MSERKDPIEQLRHIDPVDGDALASSWSTSPAKQALFQEITQMPDDTTTQPTEQRRGVPRRAVLVAATVGALSIATLAAAAALFSSQGGTSVGCQLPGGALAIDRATTGDPVVDCGALWERETGEGPPELTAYTNSNGGVVVVPASDDVPGDWQALPAGASQDPAVVELNTALDDIADGLPSDCHLLASAEDVVERELGRLGLTDWTTRPERGAADGVETCTYYYLDTANQQVALIPLEGVVPSSDHPHGEFARGLAARLAEECHDVEAAEAEVRSRAAEAGLDAPDEVAIRAVQDPAADCARVDVTVGGRIEVTLRGPAA